MGGCNGGIGLSLLSDIFQLDLGGFFIHMGEGDVDVKEDDVVVLVVVVWVVVDVADNGDVDIGGGDEGDDICGKDGRP